MTETTSFLRLSWQFLSGAWPSSLRPAPSRPCAPAAAFLPSSVVVSSIWPVAILMTWTALPITSAGRRSPLGPLGKVSLLLLDGKHIAIAVHLRVAFSHEIDCRVS